MTNPKPAIVKAVKALLRKQFPDETRWKVTEKSELKIRHRIDLVLDDISELRRKRTVIRVVANPSISESDVRSVNDAARKMSGRYVKITGKMIYAIEGSDCSVVPPDIECRFLSGWSFENGLAKKIS